jgi:hypothetical protein
MQSRVGGRYVQDGVKGEGEGRDMILEELEEG